MKKHTPAARSKRKRSLKPLGSPARAGKNPATVRNKAEFQRVVRELQVHQQELEAQNAELRETQQLLEVSRDRYADLYDFAPIGYATLDEKGHIHEINLTGAAILGQVRLRLLNTLFGMFVAKSDLKIFHHHLRQCRQSSGPVITELTLTIRGRDPIRVQLHGVPIRDPVRQTTMYRTAIRDISARVRAEEALRRALIELEDRVRERTAELDGMVVELRKEIADRQRAEEALKLFRTLVDHSIDSLEVIDPDTGRFLDVSQRSCLDLGYSREELLSMRVFDIAPDIDAAEWTGRTKALRRDKSQTVFGHHVRKDGTKFPVEVNVGLVRLDRDYLVAVVRNVTERKQAEEELRESERRLSDMLRNLDLIAVMFDRDAHIIYCNDYLLRLTGWQREEVIGRDWFELFLPPEIVDDLEDVHSNLLADQPFAWHYENEIVTRSGARRLIRWNNSLLRSPSGDVIGSASIGEDITDRKQAEGALRRLSVSLLQTRDEERRRIARELHDSTGQKLAALAMNLSLIGKSTEMLDARAREALAESVALLDQSAREIRTLSYLLHPPMLDERGLAAAVRWFTDGFSQRSGVKVKLEVPPDLPRLPEEIEMTLFRIVQEGLTNAHRHSGSSTATIRLTAEPNRVQLEVRDAGKGLSAPQADSDKTALGVGITGMRERVKQLGGEMEMETGARGTIVRVAVPLTGAAS
jgi:PAS domain S-box-containing protein